MQKQAKQKVLLGILESFWEGKILNGWLWEFAHNVLATGGLSYFSYYFFRSLLDTATRSV